ncbi:MAG: hypothetical protein EOP47_05310 [Sphingobacteriaceae bacterium]|nr:MAG: hypothetical protein EOP47_05310 [Sphingobacteriaceae bacterium]
MTPKQTYNIIFSGIIILMLCSNVGFGQNAFEYLLERKLDSLAKAKPFNLTNELMPNDAMKSVMTPTGFGGFGTYVFGGIGGVYPAVYTNRGDMISSAGFCVGNSEKVFNLAVSVNMTKVTSLSNMSANFILSKKIFTGTSMSVGALQMFAPASLSDAPSGTYYAAVSHAVQGVRSKTQGYSALTFTVGYGNGRFIQKSPYDIAAGRGSRGTGVFGNISYELFKRVNIIAEWTGLNLGFSTGLRPLKNSPFSIGIGVSDLTRFSSDKPAMMFSMGYPLALTRRI